MPKTVFEPMTEWFGFHCILVLLDSTQLFHHIPQKNLCTIFKYISYNICYYLFYNLFFHNDCSTCPLKFEIEVPTYILLATSQFIIQLITIF